MAGAVLGVWQGGRCGLLCVLRALGPGRPASVRALSAASGSLHVHLEPLEQQYDGIFALTLSNPKAANAIGTSQEPSFCHLRVSANFLS